MGILLFPTLKCAHLSTAVRDELVLGLKKLKLCKKIPSISFMLACKSRRRAAIVLHLHNQRVKVAHVRRSATIQYLQAVPRIIRSIGSVCYDVVQSLQWWPPKLLSIKSRRCHRLMVLLVTRQTMFLFMSQGAQVECTDLRDYLIDSQLIMKRTLRGQPVTSLATTLCSKAWK